MTGDELFDLVVRMRDAQKAYFRDRTAEALDHSKKLEREVDRALANRRGGRRQPELF